MWSYTGKSYPLLIGFGYGHPVLFRWEISWGVLGFQAAYELGVGLLEENTVTLHMYI